jgi:dienelactone hydrolase
MPTTFISRGHYRPLLLLMLCLWTFLPVQAQEEISPDYDFTVEEVKYLSGDITLAGMVFVPAIEPPYPALVVVHGSGDAPVETYRRFAERLAGYGFATLIYDKRGVGESEGQYSGVGTWNGQTMIKLLAGDVLAGVDYMQTRTDVDATKIGLIGSSQAGWIIPEAASQSDDVRFMVNIVGPTVSIGLENYYSQLTAGRDDPDRDYTEIAEKLAKYTEPKGYDPLPALEKIEIPGLWILGGSDSSIPTPETIAILETLVDAGKPYTITLYPDGNHNMMDIVTGERINYTPDMMEWIFGVLETDDSVELTPTP